MKWRERGLWLVIIVGIILLFRACERGCQIFKGGKSDTISVRVDTVFITIKGDTAYIPEIVGVSNTVYQTRWRTDTITEYEIRIDPVDTAAIVARCNQTVFYSDTIPIGTYGNLTVDDTISQNRIVGRGLKKGLKIPEVTKTITLREKRMVGYLGLSAMGSQETPIHAIGLDFTLKLKSDYQIGAGVKFTKERMMYYEAQFKTPIRLRKR